jgi:hypothetical protein
MHATGGGVSAGALKANEPTIVNPRNNPAAVRSLAISRSPVVRSDRFGTSLRIAGAERPILPHLGEGRRSEAAIV